MKHFLGIDIGTSGAKALALTENGIIAAMAQQEYPLSTPQPLWAEQDPYLWWNATQFCIRRVLSQVPASEITAVGLTGQMHGLVMLDKYGDVLRPAILWCDQRTALQCQEMTVAVGEETLIAETCNPVLTGFTAPKILWVRQHEPHIYDQTAMILLPKDYIRWKLCGEFATEVSDASGTSLLNVPQRRWSAKVLSALNIDKLLLPRVYESQEISGEINTAGAQATGLLAGTPVVGGGGDQAAGAVGNGIVQSGIVSVATGTSGVVFAASDAPTIDPALRVHTFCHAIPRKWHVMGVMLAAGGSLRWYRDTFCQEEITVAQKTGINPYELITQSASTASMGCEGLIFLPYLSGERTPHPDPSARGAFIGLTLRHTKAHMARAVLEGVTFGLRDSLEILRDMHIAPASVRLSGGGAKSTFWRQMQADIFGCDASIVQSDEGPALGAALLASVGAGYFASVEEACATLIKTSSTISADLSNSKKYDSYYQEYRTLYPVLKTHFEKLGNLAQA
jgi:xylulokinase